MAAGSVLDRLDGLAFSRILGRSTDGRPIVARRLGDPDQPAELLVVAGVHGDEPSTVDAVVDLVQRLDGGQETARAPFWLVPALNPDGLVRGQKNSARDVDLNRNFPAGNFTTTHQPGYFPGHTPLSEPETAALAAFLVQESIGRLVAVHAPFACVNFDGPAADWAGRVAAACGWPVQADIGYPTPGSLGTWFGVDQGRPILTLELPPGPYVGFAAACRLALTAAVAVGGAGDPAGASDRGNAMNPVRIR